MKQRTLLILAVLLLACDRTATVRMYPSAAAPGQIVHLQLASFRGDPAGLSVMAGDARVTIVARAQHSIDIIVPDANTDSLSLDITDGKKTVARSGLRVVRPRSLRLLVSVEGSRVRLLQSTPSNHQPTPDARTRRTRLSVDVVGHDNVVVYTASLPHPRTRSAEYFRPLGDGRAGGRMTESPPEAIFPVYIPAPRESVWVDVYLANRNLDLGSKEDRGKRRRLTRLEVGP